MKKVLASLGILLILLSFTSVYASAENQSIAGLNESEIIEVKENAEREIAEYNELYGDGYGMAAYILGKVRIYSIPFCVVGIAVSIIYQYIIGIRRLDIRDRGFKLSIAFVTILVVCQILPLIFAIVIRGWRS